jgi:hypothetical protein
VEETACLLAQWEILMPEAERESLKLMGVRLEARAASVVMARILGDARKEDVLSK